MKWDESRKFRTAQHKAYEPPPRIKPFWKALIIAAVVLAACIGLHLRLLFGPQKQGLGWWVFVVFPVGFAVFLAYLLPWMTTKTRSVITINVKGVHHSWAIGQHLEVVSWQWESISLASIEELEYGSKRFQAFILHLSNGSQIPLGLTEGVSIVEIEQILHAVDKKLEILVQRG